MNNYLSIANNILTGSLRPWSNENKDEEKFRHLLNHKLRQNKDNPSVFCKEVITAFNVSKLSIEIENIEELKSLSKVGVSNPLKIDLPKFFNKQTEFYSYLITNTTQCILTGIFEIIENADEVDTTYKLYQIFNRVEELISFSKTIEQNDKSSILVIDILKLHLFIIHSTLLQKYADSINFETINENEILFQICPSFDSEKDEPKALAYFINNYLSERSKSFVDIDGFTNNKTIEIQINTNQVKEVISFKPIYQDIKPILKSKADYNIIFKPNLFGEIESKLYEYEIIDIEYCFIKSKKQSNHTLLAAVYRVLIDNNYFRKNIIGKNEKCTELDIRKYLDERYCTDTSQQFRRLTKEQTLKAKTKLPWLDNIRLIS